MAETESTYALGAVCRITGLSPHVVRVWERRYGAVTPLRTPKGTRRYRVADVARLQLLRDAVDGGHRIGAVAQLADGALQALAVRPAPPPAPHAPLERAIAAIGDLDSAGAERVISDQLIALGPVRFAREFALPLLRGVGQQWASGKLCIAAEHMASALLRSLLGAALRPPPRTDGAPSVIFATLPGERHELGLLASALIAMGAGANPVYLGAELPPKELARAVRIAAPGAVALGITYGGPNVERLVVETRAALPREVELWVGGAAAGRTKLPRRVAALAGFDDLERSVRRLREARAVRVVRKPQPPRAPRRAARREA